MMSPDLQRIQHIKEYCVAIGKTIARCGNSFEVYAADEDFQRSVSFSILQIGELSGGLSSEYRQETANRVQWGPMKAMRNLVAHNYGRMDGIYQVYVEVGGEIVPFVTVNSATGDYHG